MREPLLHFALIGGLIFAVYYGINPVPEYTGKEQLVVTEADIQRMAQTFSATWNRPPNEDELTALVDSFVQEEVYVREAIGLGLDKNDPVVRQRLRQKMVFLTEASSDAINPDDKTLVAYYQANPDKFTKPARISFTQIFLGESPSKPFVEDTLINAKNGIPVNTLGNRSMLPESVVDYGLAAVEGVFGKGLFEQIQEGPADTWYGPVRSTFGQHLVSKTDYEPTSLLPFEQVRAAVEVDWRTKFLENLRVERYFVLQDQYSIITPDISGMLSK